MQSKHHKGFDMESHQWLECNIDPRKVSAIINMQEQMIETRGWKASRGLNVTTENCRPCDAYKETVMHILSGCKLQAGSDYLKWHNNALMVLIVEWAKQESLLSSSSVWYKQKWSKGTVLEKNGKKICWDFEFTMRKTTSARKPDVIVVSCSRKHRSRKQRTFFVSAYELSPPPNSTEVLSCRLWHGSRVVILKIEKSQ